jgi:hypothetical protein
MAIEKHNTKMQTNNMLTTFVRGAFPNINILLDPKCERCHQEIVQLRSANSRWYLKGGRIRILGDKLNSVND